MTLVTNERQLGLMTKRKKLLQPFLGKIKNQLNHITDQLLVTTSLSLPDADEEMENQCSIS